MYRENYINSLREEIVTMVAERLTPVAMNYGYSEVPLETNIKWRPLVLVLGNYSSGKSTLINMFLGAKIQPTGQAPTDDSFTILTYDDSLPEDAPTQVVNEYDGKYLLNDQQYPFDILRRYGERLSSHMRLKKVNSPFLRNLAIVDTPGMLDSITERDRGYNYLEVVGRLAQIADLVLVLFDPHKAGTIREAHTSIREVLPISTFEDRILFVLNRIDECTSLEDLLRVYGTLCWNLSQITGRKDIPPVHLTYAPQSAGAEKRLGNGDKGYLKYLDNQQEELKKSILLAPHHRVSHLAAFVETHSERLAHFLEGLISYTRKRRSYRTKLGLLGTVVALFSGAFTYLALYTAGVFENLEDPMLIGSGAAAAAVVGLFWWLTVQRFYVFKFHQSWLHRVDDLTPLDNQTRVDSWNAIRDLVLTHLRKTRGRFSLVRLKQQFASVNWVRRAGSREIRDALKELGEIKPEPTDAEAREPEMEKGESESEQRESESSGQS